VGEIFLGSITRCIPNSDLNEEMKWALAVTALRENKTEILDAE
jgi:hypothetical protein